MSAATILADLRPALTLELELGSEPHAASARLELWVGSGSSRCEAHVALRGWIGRVAEQRLVRALREWMKPEIERVVLDCRDARHLDSQTAHRLAGVAARIEGMCPVEIWGLPRTAGGLPNSAAVQFDPSGTPGECDA